MLSADREAHGRTCRRACVLALTIGSLVIVNSDDDAALAADPPPLHGMAWTAVNDTVMGGRSSARLSWSERKHLIWTGNLSLQNNGGFVSIRSDAPWADWSNYDGVEVILEGQGRDIQVSVQRRDLPIRGGGYRASLPSEALGDTRVFIPFAAFFPKRFGRQIEAPALEGGLKGVGRWGLLIADKRPGPFAVTLKSIKPARYPKGTRPAPRVRSAFMEAIERGVPVFNSGDVQGCAVIYRDVIQKTLADGLLGTGSWAERVCRHSLNMAAREDDRAAAWTLRRAMDAILLSLPD